MIRVCVYIDGFNLYHGLDDLVVRRGRKFNHIKWLDLDAVSRVFTDPSQHQIISIKYFTAYQKWRQDRVSRHRQYIAANEANGVQTILGQFKEKEKYCKLCKGTFKGHEEKESDVNIATHIVADAYEDKYDMAFLISRDSDLAGPLRLIRERFPKKKIRVIAPEWRRHSKELAAIATHKSVIKPFHVESCRLDEQILDVDGKVIAKCPQKYQIKPETKPAASNPQTRD